MKRIISRVTKGLTAVAMAVTMVATLMSASATVSAKTSKAQKKANKAYAQAIKKNKISKFNEYSLLEVTGGGTKELLVKNTEGRTEAARKLNIYTYSKGKVKKIWSTSSNNMGYNRKQKTIVDLRYWGGGMSESYAKYDIYKYNGKKIVKKGSYYYTAKFHYEDAQGNKVVAEDEGSPEGSHLVYDKKKYSKQLTGKKMQNISQKEYKAATKVNDTVWTMNTATKKSLIKKLSK